ncbi:MAG TPA: zinc ribbon domain-containing protein [Vicinamibacterales bacterium]|nr:zinc ribbon domain-containing protein [Vicinamibacterales bacterium]
MPLYEYACEACGKRFERIQKFADPPVDVCPTCGKGPVTKLISAPGFQFKGSGWYVTDYARKSDAAGSSASKDAKDSKESTAPAEGKDTSSTASSSDTSKDKPAASADAATKK